MNTGRIPDPTQLLLCVIDWQNASADVPSCLDGGKWGSGPLATRGTSWA